MPLYGRRTLGRPQIDTSSAEAVSGLIGLAMQFVAQSASEKLRLKEKKESQSLTLLAEKYHSVTRDLTRVEGEYDTSKRLYEAALGNVTPLNRTTGSDAVTDNLKQYYVNEFGVDPILIRKYREKQPERIPTVIESLEKLRLEAVQTKKGTGALETKRVQDIQMTDISSRISNARMFQDMDFIAKNENLNDDERVKKILALGKEEGMSLGLILDPANEPKKGDSSKVIKKKRDAQYKEVMYLLNTFSSFTKKDAAKDVIGLGNFVNRLSKISGSLSPGAQSGFKKYVNNYFNIDLDNKEHFMLPGFTLEAGQTVEESFDVRDMDKMTAEDLVLSDFKISGLSKFDYMDMDETRDKIFSLYKRKHPNLSDAAILSRIKEAYKLL